MTKLTAFGKQMRVLESFHSSNNLEAGGETKGTVKPAARL
jgi:hypothetical protein